MNRIYKDKEIYEEAKRRADETYKKPSAYKSGYIIKTYHPLKKELKDYIHPIIYEKTEATSPKD